MISTLVFIISSISIEIHDEIEPQRKTYFRPNHRRYYVIDKNSQQFLYRLRRATKLMMFKSDSDQHKKPSTTDKVVKAVKTVAKEIKEIKGHKHKDKSHHKDSGHHFKSGKGHKSFAKIVSISFKVASISILISFSLPKLFKCLFQ